MPPACSSSVTSLRIFRAFLDPLPDGTFDAHRVISLDCYQAWLRARGCEESDKQAKSFQRALTNHVSGVDGRSPFEKEEEAAILRVLRKKQLWPCFPRYLAVGRLGFRSRGYHEKIALDAFPPTSALPSAWENLSALRSSSASTIATNAANEEKAMSVQALARYEQLARSLHVLACATHLDATKSIFGILRFAIAPLANQSTAARHRTHTTADLDRLSHGPSNYATRHYRQQEFVLVVDFQSQDQLVLAQNEAGIRLFGNKVVGSHCGQVLKCFDTYQLVLALCAAFATPGKDFILLSAVNAALAPVPSCSYLCRLRLDPDSNLIVLSGVPHNYHHQ